MCPKEADSVDEEHIAFLEAWTSKLLGASKTSKLSDMAKRRGACHTIVFGQTYHPELDKRNKSKGAATSSSYSSSSNSARVSFPAQFSSANKRERCVRKSFDEITTLSTNTGTTQLNRPDRQGPDIQVDKIKGKQMVVNSVHDHAVAKEKRTRAMKYASELKASSSTYVDLQISSITRIIVRSFRNLIACERCALFIMDHKTNELYFKPVGHDNSDPTEIRFSATMGVAGWVASHKEPLNIRNVHHDKRFNPEIDMQTNFRTRTILCSPVLSSKGRVLGVIQMVNKKTDGDARKMNNIARRRKSDNNNHGYASCFESFSTEDEETINKCCNEVAKALEPIFFPKQNINEDTQKSAVKHTVKHTVDRLTSGRRRSSLANLFQFVHDKEKPQPKKQLHESIAFGSSEVIGISEAFSKFQFRSTAGPQISSAAKIDNDLATSKRRRMEEYNRQLQNKLGK